MAAQETGYKLQAAGPATRSWLQLCVAGYMPGSAACRPHSNMQLRPATSSYKVQQARAFSVKASYKLQLRTARRLQAEGFFDVADLGSTWVWPKKKYLL